MENEENQNQVSLRFPPPLEIAPRFPQSHNPDDDSPLPKTQNQKARKEPQRLKKPQPPSSGSSFDEKMLPERQAVSEKVLDLALALAKFEGSELHVLHAWKAFREATLRGRAGVRHDEVRKYVASVRTGARKAFDELLAKFDLPKKRGRVHLLDGDAAVVIADLVKKKRIDLLVMGTVARTGISGLLIGNTAERVVGSIGCSLLTVKPDGFVSPIQLEGEAGAG